MKTAAEVAREVVGADALAGIGYERDLEIATRAIEADRAQREETPEFLHLTTTMTRRATSEEVVSLVHGTGALSWEWWKSVDEQERDGVTGYLFEIENPEQGAPTLTRWVSEQQILDAAAWFISNGFVNDRIEAATESVGYLDAIEADNALQRAVLGEVTFS